MQYVLLERAALGELYGLSARKVRACSCFIRPHEVHILTFFEQGSCVAPAGA